MKKRANYTPEEKKKILDDMKANNLSITETAKKHKLSTATLYKWKPTKKGKKKQIRKYKGRINVLPSTPVSRLAEALKDVVSEAFKHELMKLLSEK